MIVFYAFILLRLRPVRFSGGMLLSLSHRLPIIHFC